LTHEAKYQTQLMPMVLKFKFAAIMKQFGFLVLIAVMCFCNHAFGQDYVYSLNQFAPLIYHPSSVATDNEANLSFLNRKTQIGPGINYQNNVFNAKYPLIDKKTGRRFGGIGLNFLKKDAGNSDLLESTTIGISAAYNLQIARDHFVSFGIQSNYNNIKTSVESLTSGNQWLANEFRFDRNAPLGEPIAQNRVNYFSVNAGAMWYLVDKTSHAQKAFAGLSAFNINRPNQSFFQGQSRIPMGYLLNAGAIVYHTKSFQLIPQMLYQYDNHANAVNVLMSNKIFFRNENPYDIIHSGSIELLGKYDFKKDLGLGIVFHQPGISLGFNYNVALSSQNKDQYFRNAFEFGVKLSRLVWKPEPTKVTINTSSLPKRNFEFGNGQSNTTQPATQKTETDIIQKNIEDYSKVAAVQFELEKDFKFSFGRTELNADARAYLDDLLKLLQNNPEYNLEVIGHTDSVGKHLVNYKLSAGRAQAVADYLLKKGLNKERIRSKGMGDTQPVAPNDTEENRSKNRRVQFVIYVNR
jgi:type IX secretion system PorP/SprF family membrane protein